MEGKEQIIQLGKLLREELDRGCDDGAAAGGIERFLTAWRLEADGALQHTAVQQTLELLAGYAMFDVTKRRARIAIALEQLRGLLHLLLPHRHPAVFAVELFHMPGDSLHLSSGAVQLVR